MNEISRYRYAVTGATGFVGRYLVNQLLQLGVNVSILVRDPSRIETGIQKNLRIIEGDLSDQKAIKSLVKDADILIHLAAYVHKPMGNQDQQDNCKKVNLLGTKNLIDICSRNNQSIFFLFFSTVSVYGKISDPALESQRTNPGSIYGQTKLAAENYLMACVNSGNIRGCILRPSSIVGENAPGNFSKLIRLIKRGFYPVFNQGKNKKSLVHVDDVVRGILLALDKNDISNGQIYNISSASPMQISGICKTISATLRNNAWAINLPKEPFVLLFSVWDSLAILLNGRLPLLKRSLEVFTSEDVISIEKIQAQLGFEPLYSVKEGIANMVKGTR